MNKAEAEKHDQESDRMLPEYNFTGKQGVRGKYYPYYQKGHTVKIHESDGSISILYFTLEEGAVMLEPDVREYFPNSESVNNALRSLIALIPEKRARRLSARKNRKTDMK